MSIVEVLDFKAMSHLVIDIAVASRLKIIISLAILEDWEDADFVVVRDVGHLPLGHCRAWTTFWPSSWGDIRIARWRGFARG